MAELIKIEFFHDVTCSFCYPMSYRMRQIQKIYPEIEILHRSFPLTWEAKDFDTMFGSRKKAREEILKHWEHANQNDDLHRFNIAGMRKQTFDFPTSKNALLAAKAASLTAGEEGYWEVFDRLQKALFTESKNIEDTAVIYQCIKETSLDFQHWEAEFSNEKTRVKLEEDFKLIDKYKITSVPTLIINEKYILQGAQSLASIIETIHEVRKKDGDVEQMEGAACKLVDGKWTCD